MTRITYSAGVAVVEGCAVGCVWGIDGTSRYHMLPGLSSQLAFIEHFAGVYWREFAYQLHTTTASSTFVVQQLVWCVRYRTAAAAVELYSVDAEM